jgi:hypothetical protein
MPINCRKSQKNAFEKYYLKHLFPFLCRSVRAEICQSLVRGVFAFKVILSPFKPGERIAEQRAAAEKKGKHTDLHMQLTGQHRVRTHVVMVTLMLLNGF